MSSPYRITTRIFAQAEGDHVTALANSEDFRAYLDRLQKLIPSDIIGIYLFVRSLSAHSAPASLHGFDFFVNRYLALACLVTLLPLRAWGTREPGESIQWGVVSISGISFCLWVYLIGDDILGFTVGDMRIIVSFAAVWTLITTWIYKGEKRFEGGVPL